MNIKNMKLLSMLDVQINSLLLISSRFIEIEIDWDLSCFYKQIWSKLGNKKLTRATKERIHDTFNYLHDIIIWHKINEDYRDLLFKTR